MKPEITALIIKSEDKLLTAKINLDNNRFDDSISRSYYAVFHAISACLLTKNLVFSTHAQTIGAFNKEFIKTSIFPKDYSKIIQSLFDDRHSGDYDVYYFADRNLAQLHYNNSQRLIDDIKNYLKHIKVYSADDNNE